AGRSVRAACGSPIRRIQQVLTLAAEHGRRVALLGMSMEKNVRVASDLGYLRVPADLVMPLDDLVALPPGRQVILSTGSQGEPNSALSLLATGEHRAMQVERGDLVIISARVIPGNERTIGRVINALLRRGADVLYEDNAFVHVSGHASQEDLKLMLNLTRPRYFMPVHGEYRHLLGHARLAESVGLASDRVFLVEDGAVVEMTKTAARVIGHLPVDRVLVDGKGIGDIGSVVLRDRQILAESGLGAGARARRRRHAGGGARRRLSCCWRRPASAWSRWRRSIPRWRRAFSVAPSVPSASGSAGRSSVRSATPGSSFRCCSSSSR